MKLKGVTAGPEMGRLWPTLRCGDGVWDLGLVLAAVYAAGIG